MSAWLTNLRAELATVTPVGWTAIGCGVALFAGYVWISIRRRRALTSGSPVDKADRLLLVFALAFVAIIFGSFMVGTFEGSSAFGVDKLGWTNWQRAVPWGSLDAGSIGFSLLAIRAIRKERSPKPALRVVFLTAGMSATIQMMEGGKEHHWQAGLFLAFLAGVSAYALHIVIEQLRKVGHVAADIRVRKYPPFALRWLTSFPSTLCAWLAWVNYPPLRITPSVANALVHLEAVRAAKRARMVERPSWWFVQPWLYASRVVANAEATRAELESTRLAAVAESTRLTELATRLSVESADSIRELTARVEAAELASAERESAARVETESRIRGEFESQLTELRTQLRSASSRPDPRTPRPRVEKTPQVETIASDDSLTERLFDSFRAEAIRFNSPPLAYWVKKNGPCWTRQSQRVHELLMSRLVESNPEFISAAGRESSESDSLDSERDRVAVNS